MADSKGLPVHFYTTLPPPRTVPFSPFAHTRGGLAPKGTGEKFFVVETSSFGPGTWSHLHDATLRHEFGLDASGIRLWCMLQASEFGDRWLGDISAVRQHLRNVRAEKPQLWLHMSHAPLSSTVPNVPRMWARQFLMLTLGAYTWEPP
jgi:hypothetical protein